MNDALLRSRVTDARVARLATVTTAGRPHVVPCCFAIADRRLFIAVDDIKAKSSPQLRRLENIRHQPAVSVLVDHYADDWSALWWIRMDGQATIVPPQTPEAELARGLLATKYDQYRVRPPPGPVIAVRIDTWRAWP